MGETTTYHQVMVRIGHVSDKGIGIDEGLGETETVIDQRDGWEIVRPKLKFLPRSRCRVLNGTLERGQMVLLEIPSWAAKNAGLTIVRETA